MLVDCQHGKPIPTANLSSQFHSNSTFLTQYFVCLMDLFNRSVFARVDFIGIQLTNITGLEADIFITLL
jgi:hypothetical protein